MYLCIYVIYGIYVVYVSIYSRMPCIYVPMYSMYLCIHVPMYTYLCTYESKYLCTRLDRQSKQ